MHSNNNCIFRTRFYLLAAFLIHAGQAAVLWMGLHYFSAEAKSIIYEGFPLMIAVDRGTAVGMAVAAVCQLIASFGIGKNKSYAAAAVGAGYILLIVVQIGYAAARHVITGLGIFTYSSVLQIIAYAALLTVNLINGRKQNGRSEKL